MKGILEKLKQTVEILTAPAAAVALVWGFDVGLYVAATSGLIISILSYIQLFLKD